MNSQSAESPSVTRMRSAARNAPGAVSTWASTLPVQKASGGDTTNTRSPLTLV